MSILVEVLAIAVLVAGILYATLLTLYRLLRRRRGDHYLRYRSLLGRSLLLGLEILVAADVIRTVALDLSLESVAELGLLVLVRTFLGWAVVVEIERRWPWQAERHAEQSEGARRPGDEEDNALQT